MRYEGIGRNFFERLDKYRAINKSGYQTMYRIPGLKRRTYLWNGTNRNPQKNDCCNHSPARCVARCTGYLPVWGPPQPVPDALIYQNSTGIALDSVGNILVTTRNHAVRKYSSSGEVMTTWDSKGSGKGQAGWATYSGSDSQGFVYIADQKNRRIEKFSSDGTYVTHWDYFRRRSGVVPRIYNNMRRGLGSANAFPWRDPYRS